MKQAELHDHLQYGSSELHLAEGLMNGDKPLTPKMIASLMHVDVSVRSTIAHHSTSRQGQGHSFGYIISLTFVSVGIAILIGSGFLYLYNIGPFYASSDSTIE